MGKVVNIDHLEGKAHVEVFDWRKEEKLVDFRQRMHGPVKTE